MVLRSILRIENLHPEKWKNLTVEKRLQALNDMEYALADQENRIPRTVTFMQNEDFKNAEEKAFYYGYDDEIENEIRVNRALLDPDTSYKASYGGTPVNPNEPYVATHTLFHESRHAYQKHDALSSDSTENPQKHMDFQMNRGPGYVPPDEDLSLYLSQPVEVDARNIARQRTEQLFSQEFNDSSVQFNDHLKKSDDQEELFARHCTNIMGPNYENIARKEVYDRSNNYYKNLGQKESSTLTDTQIENIAEETDSTKNEHGEDHDYYYGHGL